MSGQINFNKYSIQEIKESDKYQANEFKYNFVPNKFMIEDSRFLSDFKKNTLGGYPKTKVNQALEKCLHSAQIEHACYWSYQLLISGQINQLWDKLINFSYKNINLGNPQIPNWIYEREKTFKELISNKIFTKDSILQTRNIQIFRNLITEFVVMCCLSKNRKIENLKNKITDVDFVISNFHKKMRSKDNMIISNLFGDNDPKEIKYAGNEFAFHLINKNMQDSLYWLNWILYWEKSNTKKYGSFKITSRNIEGIEGDYQTDCIWLIWSIFHNLKYKIIENIKINNNIGYSNNQKKNKKYIQLLELQLDSLWKLYVYKWKPGNKNKKLIYLIWSLHLLIFPVDWETKLYEKIDIYVKAVSNVNLMFEKIKKQCIVFKYNNSNLNNSNLNKSNLLNSNNSNLINYSSLNNEHNLNNNNNNILNMSNNNQILNNLNNNIKTNGINVIVKNNYKLPEKKQEELLKKRDKIKKKEEKKKDNEKNNYVNKLDIVAKLDEYLNI